MSISPEVVEVANDFLDDFLSWLGKLFGIRPRGDLQKFHRTIYPYMAGQARLTGLPVYVFWFGDTVVVNPDAQGSFGVAASSGVIDNYYLFLNQLKDAGKSFYRFHCDSSVDWDSPTQLQSMCTFVGYNINATGGDGGGAGDGTTPTTNPVGDPLKAGITILGALLLLGFLLSSSPGKGGSNK